METKERKDSLLQTAGEPLVFPQGTVLGVNGEPDRIFQVVPDSLTYDTDDYYYQITEEDCKQLLIAPHQYFEIRTNITILTFEVVRLMRDVYGWVKVYAILRREQVL